MAQVYTICRGRHEKRITAYGLRAARAMRDNMNSEHRAKVPEGEPRDPYHLHKPGTDCLKWSENRPAPKRVKNREKRHG